MKRATSLPSHVVAAVEGGGRRAGSSTRGEARGTVCLLAASLLGPLLLAAPVAEVVTPEFLALQDAFDLDRRGPSAVALIVFERLPGLAAVASVLVPLLAVAARWTARSQRGRNLRSQASAWIPLLGAADRHHRLACWCR